MAFFTFQSPGAEILGNPAANENDTFVASNFNLNAGDRALGGLGTDRLEYFADLTLTPTVAGGTTRTFSGFILDSVETFSVTNDSGLTLIFDLSSSSFTDGRQGVSTLEVANSTFGVVFDQVGRTNTPGGNPLAAIRLDSQTSPATSNVTVGYQANLLNVAGQTDVVDLTLSNTNAAVVRIGTSNGGAIGAPTNTGVETVNLTVTNGASVVQQLDTDLTTLNVSASANFVAGDGFTITGPLNTTVRTITSQFQGNIGLSWANNGAAQGVTFTGSQTGTGVNTLTAGAGNDTITTFAGADVIDGGAGNDVISAGNGQNRITTGAGTDTVTGGVDRDRVFANGPGTKTVDLGAGDDVVDYSLSTATLLFTGGTGNDIVFAGGNFNAGPGLDRLDFGAGVDFLFVDGGETDAQFAQVTGLEYILITSAGTTTLAGNAFNAGIDSIVLQSGSNAADVVNAAGLNRSVTVRSFNGDGILRDSTTLPFAERFTDAVSGPANNDTITTGAFADAFEWRGDNSLTGADTLDAGGSAAGTSDGLYLNGDTTLNTAAVGGGIGFRNFEFVALESAYGSIYNPAATTLGNQYNLVISNANAPSAGRDLVIDGSFLNVLNNGLQQREDVVISTAAVTAFRTVIVTGNGFDTVTLGNQNDVVTTRGGDDTINDGTGNNIIDSGLGNDTVNLLAGNNTVFDEGGNNTITLGTGNDTVFVSGGNDLIIAGANLTAADTLVDNGGTDTVRVGGRNYADADFTGVAPTGSQAFEILQIAGDGTTTVLGANAERAGFRTVVSQGAGASIIDAGQFTAAANLTVDLTAGGDDTVILGAGNDTVITGVGNNTIVGNAGNDVVRVSGAELNVLDVFQGGMGTDAVELDNSLGAITAVVDLSRITSVENFRFTSNGDRIIGIVDADANNLTFAATNANTVNTLTPINIDTSTITDVSDSATITLDLGLNDADFAFNISGNSVRTTVVKNNVGINNNINFQGGTGVDTFVVSGVAGGSDLGSTTVFDGMGGEDVIFQNGGVINDDSYVQVQNVEVLTGAAGALNATLGAQAARSGLQIIRGTSGNDAITLDAAFVPGTNTGTPSVPRLTVDLGTGGDDQINASASAIAVTFATVAAGLTAADILQGGTSANDVLNITTGITPGQTSDATSVTGVERINVTLPANNIDNDTTLTIDTTLAEVNGGTQTITAAAATGFENSVLNDFILNAQAATANLVVTSAGGFDEIRTGSGADTITTNAGSDVIVSGLGIDTINAGTGNDTINAGAGNDIINAGPDTGSAGGDSDRVVGGAGQDTINGGDGADFIRGWIDSDTIAIGAAGLNPGNENDVINGGAGNDIIEGGAGLDTLTGGDGADIFLYRNRADSTLGVAGRDVITDFVSGVDRIDAVSVRDAAYAPGAQVRFAGNATNFGDAQSLINANDGIFDIVYDQSTDVLYFDLNDDGTLDGNDLQIVVRGSGFTVNGDFGLQSQDVLAGVATVGGGNYAAFDLTMSTVPA